MVVLRERRALQLQKHIHLGHRALRAQMDQLGRDGPSEHQHRHLTARTKAVVPNDSHEVPVSLEVLLNKIRERALEDFLNAVEAAPSGAFPGVLEVEEKGHLRGIRDIPG